MSSLGSIDIDGKATIGNALALKNMKVPIYQRSYAWEEKHVLDFYHDLEGAINHNSPEYFLGSIVVTQKPGETQVEVVEWSTENRHNDDGLGGASRLLS